MNLGEVVLCGRVLTTEQAPGGSDHARGCRLSRSGPRCKRATRGRRIVPFHAIRARRLILLSCNGFRTASYFHPAVNSIILSAVDGYLAQIVAPVSALPVDSLLPSLAGDWLRRGLGGTAVARILNDLEARRCGHGSYVVVGAADFDRLRALLRTGDRVPVSAGALSTIFQVPPEHSDEVIGLARASAAAGYPMLRGERWGIVAHGPQPPIRAIKVVSRETALAHLEETLPAARGVSERAARMERALRGRYLTGEAPAAARAHLASMAMLRDHLEEQCHVCTREVGLVRQAGVFNPTLEQRQATLGLLTQAWDQAFAALVLRFLWNGKTDGLFTDGLRLEASPTDEACQHCGTPLTSRRAFASIPGPQVHQAIDCPTCGPLAAWDRGLAPLRVRLSGPLAAGGEAAITVSLPAAAGSLPPVPGCLAIELRDKARNRPFLSEYRIGPAPSVRLEVRVPASVRPDLHTLKALFVRAAEVSFVRQRHAVL